MKRLICTIVLAIFGFAQATPFDCKPSATPNGEAQSGDTVIRLTTVGAFAAWRCKSNGRLQMAVVRHDFVTDGLRWEWDQFRRDPSFVRMNSILATRTTGDWRTDPRLVEVWAPYKTQIDALK